jgi:hypothetical protein
MSVKCHKNSPIDSRKQSLLKSNDWLLNAASVQVSNSRRHLAATVGAVGLLVSDDDVGKRQVFGRKPACNEKKDR